MDLQSLYQRNAVQAFSWSTTPLLIKMINKYDKGRRKEYKIIHLEKEKGFIAFRSAGSHSPVDVVSIDTKNHKIRLIQCKPDSMNSHQRQKLRDENQALNGLFDVSFSVI